MLIAIMAQYAVGVKRRMVLMMGAVAPAAVACSCVTVGPAEWPFPDDGGKGMLFRGTAREIRELASENGRRRFAVTFGIHEYWRGKVGRQVTVEVTLSGFGGDCLPLELGYRKGVAYLVYASAVAPHVEWGACVPVGEVARLPKVMEALGRGRKPAV
jgi:hypothetical protein